MKPRSIAAVAVGALLVGTALLMIPVKAMATGTAGDDPDAAALSSALASGDFLAGYDTGLYRVRKDGSGTDPLWTGAEVRKIVRRPRAGTSSRPRASFSASTSQASRTARPASP